jgi:phage-related protein
MPIDLNTNQIIDQNKLITDNIELLLIEFIYKNADSVRVCLNNAEITWNSKTWMPAIFSLTGMNETKDAEIPKVKLNFFDLNKVIIPVIEDTDGLPDTKINIYVIDSKYLDNTTPKIHEQAFINSVSFNENGLVTIEIGTENLSLMRVPKNRYLKNHCRFKFKEFIVKFQNGSADTFIDGDFVKGFSSNNTGVVSKIRIDSGSFDNGDAQGWLNITSISGIFSNGENLSTYTDNTFGTIKETEIAQVVSSSSPCGFYDDGTETNCNRTFARCKELGNEERFGGFPAIGSYGIFK